MEYKLEKPIKVVHLIAGDLNGGAAKGAYWLHKGLLKQGIDSYIITTSQYTFGEERISSIAYLKNSMPSRFKKVIESNLIKAFRKEESIFSSGFFGENIFNHPFYRKADIIHLHWVNSNFISTSTVKKIKKPIVWTMRDMWTFTGGCHYSLECEKYKTGCGNCPILGSKNKKDMSFFISMIKKKAYESKKISFVGISEFISSEARKSHILKNERITTIYNSIDTTEFKPIKKETAREILGIDASKKIILSGSTRLKDNYKGFGKLLDSLEKLDKENFSLLLFGASNERDLLRVKIKCKRFGYISDTTKLRLIYSAADVFVSTSIQEAFAKTIVEAMACGTPVVCFDYSGPGEIVDHMITGYKAKPFESLDISNGIKQICFSENHKEICQNAINVANERYSTMVSAKKYIELYKAKINE